MGHLSNPAIVYWKVVEKTADQTVNNSNTLIGDDELEVNMPANTSIWFICQMLCISTAVADLTFGWEAPTGAVMHWSNDADSDTTRALADTLNIACAAANLQVRIVRGFVRNGNNAGYWRLKWAQQVAEATDTKMLKGSFITYKDSDAAGTGAG